MVISSELALSPESIGVNPVEVYEIYEELAEIHPLPTIHAVYGHYCMVVDSRLSELQLKYYLDDYDSSSDNIPDYIKNDVMNYVGLPINMTPEEIHYLLDRANLTYWSHGLVNSPIQEVW